MEHDIFHRLCQLGTGATLATALLGQANIATASPIFQPIVNAATITAMVSGRRSEHGIVEPLILAPSERSSIVLVGHRSHSSHSSHSSHHSGQGFGGSYRGGSSGSGSSSMNSYYSGSSSSGSGNQSAEKAPAAPARQAPPKIERPAGYKELRIPTKLYVESIVKRPNGVLSATIRDGNSDRTEEVMLFDSVDGWTVTEIDATHATITLENTTAAAPNIPKVILKKK